MRDVFGLHLKLTVQATVYSSQQEIQKCQYLHHLQLYPTSLDRWKGYPAHVDPVHVHIPV